MPSVLQGLQTTADKLAVARKLGDQLARTPEVQASFLAGSVVEGFCNATSDIDIYLVGPDLTLERQQLAVDVIRVDVHRLPNAVIDGAVDRVLSAKLLIGSAPVPIADRDLALVAGLWTAEVFTGEELISVLRDRLHAGRERVRRQVMFRWMTAAHADLEDFTGLVAEGDLDAAMMVGRSALIAAGKALVAAGGDLYGGQKWVWRQLERSAPPQFPHETFERLLRSDLVTAGGGESLSDLAGFTQTCLAVAATLGWENVPLQHWPSWCRASGSLSRTSGFYPRAFDGAVVLTKPPVRRVRLRPEAALIWGLCNGSTEEAVTAHVQELREYAVAYERCNAQRCHDIIALLMGAKLVSRG